MPVKPLDKYLLIVESPNKVKTISGILKANGYKNFTVVASVGHIMSLADGGTAYNSGIYPEKQFKMNLKVSDDKKKTVSDLTAACSSADKVYLMTDGDREGELIAWSIIKFCKVPVEKCCRVITHEITPKAIIRAIENPIPLNTDLVDAGLCRMMTDKLIGYGLSPLGKKYIGARSIGRCQSVGLKLVSDRETEISEFIPELFFDLYLYFKKNDKDFKAKYAGYKEERISHFTKEPDALAVINDCKGRDFVVKDITTKLRQESPKLPFSTATFQQEAVTRLGLRAKDAMSCAQKLFEGITIDGEHTGLITYMRTDSTSFADEFIPELEQFITKSYGKDAFVKPRKSKKKSTDQDGHEALRVVDPALTPEKLDSILDNKLLVKVYNIIWQRTVAACMKNACIEETSYKVCACDHFFVFEQNRLTSPGYKIVYGKDGDKTLFETFEQDEVLTDTNLDLAKKFTQPKPRYTESSLIQELETRGIGRPSTYVSIVETLLNPTRNYAVLENKSIVPTDRGMQLAQYCSRAFPDIISLDYTKNMEGQLDRIANGDLALQDYMTVFYNKLKEVIGNTTETGIEQTDEVRKCPLCDNDMILRRSKFGKLFYGCSAYPKCKGILNL